MQDLLKLVELEKDARKFGFNWPDKFAILDHIISEVYEVKKELEFSADSHNLQEEIGDLLHIVFSLCISAGFSIDDTIGKINIKFSNRINALKKLTKLEGLEDLNGQDKEFILQLWQRAKKLV
jgi:uncharacterized protein YabN with tetrapyrrole methylase and pyrophosphatase domain